MSMSKRIHVNAKLWLKDVHMIRIEYTKETPSYTLAHGRLMRKLYREVQSSWAYTDVSTESYMIEDKHAPQPLPVTNAAGNPFLTQIIISSVEYVIRTRAYIAFTDEQDALAFRLGLDNEISAVRVYMWPQRLFTIHEYTDSTA